MAAVSAEHFCEYFLEYVCFLSPAEAGQIKSGWERVLSLRALLAVLVQRLRHVRAKIRRRGGSAAEEKGPGVQWRARSASSGPPLAEEAPPCCTMGHPGSERLRLSIIGGMLQARGGSKRERRGPSTPTPWQRRSRARPLHAARRSCKVVASRSSHAARLGERCPREVKRQGDTSVAPENVPRRAAHAPGKGANVLDPAGEACSHWAGRLGTQRPGWRSAAPVRPRADKPRVGSLSGRVSGPELAGG